MRYEICKYDIDHVTITTNMVEPEIGARIYPLISEPEHGTVFGLTGQRDA